MYDEICLANEKFTLLTGQIRLQFVPFIGICLVLETEVKSFTHGIPWHGQRKEERRVVMIVKTKTMKKPETIRGKLILKRENVQRQSI